MDPRALLQQSPPSQETPPSSSRSVPAHYEPPPASSSSASAPNAPLPPVSPPTPSPCIKIEGTSDQVHSGRATVTDSPSPCIKIEGTSDEVRTGGATAIDPASPCTKIEGTSDEVHTGGYTGTGDSTISDEPPAQDHTHSLASSTAPTISTLPLSSGAVADARRSIFRRLFRPTTDPTLPVTNPQPVGQSKFRRLKEWHKSCQGRLLPDSVIQVRIAVCGFAFYGIMALLGNTWDLVKEFKDNNKAIVLCLIGFVWTVATIAVPLTMSARTTLDKALSQHATRLVLLGITLHMLFNVSLMLPENVWMASKINLWSLAALVFLLALAIIGHGASWIQSTVYGELEEKPADESGNNMAGS